MQKEFAKPMVCAAGAVHRADQAQALAFLLLDRSAGVTHGPGGLDHVVEHQPGPGNG